MIIPPSAPPPPVGARRGAATVVTRGPVLWAALAAFFATLLLAVWHNDFPGYYHPDEPTKVAQLLSDDRNFNHPPLMLSLASATLRLSDLTAEPDRIVQVGRWLSAIEIAAANGLFTLVAGIYGGALAAALAAALLTVNPQAVLAGHFFKEDPLLLLGFALTALAGAWRWRTPGSRFSLPLLGCAAGIAISSKYLGAMALAHALALEACLPAAATGERRLDRVLRLGLAAQGAVLLLNAVPLIAHLPELGEALAQVGRVAREGNDAVGARVPHLQFVGMFLANSSPLVLAGFLLAAWELRRAGWQGARVAADRWLLVLAPLALIALHSFSALVATRYLLPVQAFVACAGSVGLAQGIRWVQRRARTAVLPAMLAMAVWTASVAWPLPDVAALEENFGQDDRRALRSWVRASLPSGAVIAQDDLAALAGFVGQLPGGVRDDVAVGDELSVCVLSRKSVADLGDVRALRAAGITHVLVCRYGSRRFLEGNKRATASGEKDFARRREFYQELMTTTRCVWKSALVEPHPLRPGLELYALDPAATTVRIGSLPRR